MMEINIEKLLESGMSPESIGKMVQLEAQKKQEKNKKAEAAKVEEARTALIDAFWNYMQATMPNPKANKESFCSKLSQEILGFEEILANPMMQQIFEELDYDCNSKKQPESSQKFATKERVDVAADGCKCDKASSADIDIDIDDIIRDFLRTL